MSLRVWQLLALALVCGGQEPVFFQNDLYNSTTEVTNEPEVTITNDSEVTEKEAMMTSAARVPAEFYRDVIRDEFFEVNSVVFVVRKEDLATSPVFLDHAFLTENFRSKHIYFSTFVVDAEEDDPRALKPDEMPAIHFFYPSLYFIMHAEDFHALSLNTLITSQFYVKDFDEYESSRHFTSLRLDSRVYSFSVNESDNDGGGPVVSLTERYGVKNLPRSVS